MTHLSLCFFPLFKQKKAAAAKASDMKRTRIERSVLEDLLFKHFEEQSYWTLKQLVAKTEQPEVWCGGIDVIPMVLD